MKQEVSRRKFVVSAAATIVTAVTACGVSPENNDVLGGPSPLTLPSTQPTATTNTTPVPPTPTQSNFGNFYKSVFAGVSGSVVEVLRASQLDPEVNPSNGLLVAINGRRAPEPANAQYETNVRNGFYFFLVNGERVGNAARDAQVNVKDTIEFYDWNGKSEK